MVLYILTWTWFNVIKGKHKEILKGHKNHNVDIKNLQDMIFL